MTVGAQLGIATDSNRSLVEWSRVTPLKAAVFASLIVLASCRAPPPVVAPESRPLERTALVVLDKEACDRLKARTFSLEDSGATSGKLWVRKCSTQQGKDALDINVDVLGWQWVGAGSSGFSVDEYVYFHAAVSTRARAAIEVKDDRPSLRVFSSGDLDVTVRDIGRVSARAATPAARLLGVASTLLGASPNTLATSALRGRVKDMIKKNARSGLLVALSGGTAPVLDETQVLHPDGALISGSYPPNVATRLQFDLLSGKTALARAVCVDEAAMLVDAVIDARDEPRAAAPTDVVTLKDHGAVDLEPPACPWVLVTGAAGQEAVTVHVTLAFADAVRPRIAGRRWVRPTIRAYAIEGVPEAGLFQFRVEHARRLGRPLTSARSPSVWVTAEPVELLDGEPLVITATQLSPKKRDFWSGTTSYEQKPLGRASTTPEPGVRTQDRHVPLEENGRTVGFVDVSLESVEAP
jgi:hypothetical protein